MHGLYAAIQAHCFSDNRIPLSLLSPGTIGVARCVICHGGMGIPAGFGCRISTDLGQGRDITEPQASLRSVGASVDVAVIVA